jgi:hypothetical protein
LRCCAAPCQLDEACDVVLGILDVLIKDVQPVQLSSTTAGNSANTLQQQQVEEATDA